MIDSLLQMVESYQIKDNLVIVFYDTDLWLASCEFEIRQSFREKAEIKIIKLHGNSEDPFNVCLCDDLYFNCLTERDLTLKLLNQSKLYLEERISDHLNNLYQEPLTK